MNLPHWLIVHFRPTGTTLKIARAIAKGSDCLTHELDLSDPEISGRVEEHEVLLATVPVFSGRVPTVALERLARLQGNGQNAVAVVVYGNRHFDDALLELTNALTQNGFHVIAAAAMIAEHSMIRSIAAGRPDADDEKAAQNFGVAVLQKISRSEEKPSKLSIPGNIPYKTPGAVPAYPKAGENCTQCGACAKRCPVDAISFDAPNQTKKEQCIHCMRCISICLQKARAISTTVYTTIEGMLKKIAIEPRQPEFFL